MGDARHHARTITVPAVRTGGAAMGHRTQELASIRDDFVRVLTLDVADEADTARIFFEFVQVKTLGGGQGRGPGIGVAFYFIKTDKGILLISIWRPR